MMDYRIAGYRRRWTGAGFVVLIALSLLGAQAAFAAEQVGRVVSANGRVTAEQPDVSARSLARGDAIYAGDTIVTSRRGRVQMRFRDDGMVDLEPLSRFRVEEYRGDQGGGNVVLSFLRGAMRTITGAIGYDSGESYRMETPVATIGVRGTAYALRYCDAACVEAGGEAGLYGRVDKGAIVADGVRFEAGQYFFVPEDGPPRRIVAPPGGILDGRDDSRLQGSDERITDVRLRPLETGEERGYRPALGRNEVLHPDFNAGENRTGGAMSPNAPAPAPLGGVSVAVGGTEGIMGVEFAGVDLLDEGGPFNTNGSNQVIEAELQNLTPSVGAFVPLGTPVNADIGDVTLAESGTTLGVDWGRWNGVVNVDGPNNSGTLDGANFAFTITDDLTAPQQLAGLQGSLSYSLAGGPRAFDKDSDLWTVTNLDFTVDFDAANVALVAFNLTEPALSDGENIDSFTFTGGSVTSQDVDLDANRFNIVLNKLGDAGAIDGRFLGGNADGAIVVFEVHDSDGIEEVTGTKILTTP